MTRKVEGKKPVETFKIGREAGHAGPLHLCLTRRIFTPSVNLLIFATFLPKHHMAFMLHSITTPTSQSSIPFFIFILLQQIQIKERKTKTTKMTSSKLFLLVLCLGVCVGICMSWVEDVAEPDTEFLPNWLRNTFSQSLGSENDDATQNMNYKAEDAATDAKEAIGSDEIIRMATDKLTNYDIKNGVKGGMDCGVNDEAKDELSSVKNSMSEEAKAKYEAAKEKASEATGNVGAKMRNTP
ncbi:unnamed protein product [Vicia faba]|uniref:Uncharacterized protein n=1 Tax=Vicia faba TaxID=3906 RepID=A0AAV0YS42_VICFA|nr:unnamed protein product [Vicia faba]